MCAFHTYFNDQTTTVAQMGNIQPVKVTERIDHC